MMPSRIADPARATLADRILTAVGGHLFGVDPRTLPYALAEPDREVLGTVARLLAEGLLYERLDGRIAVVGDGLHR